MRARVLTVGILVPFVAAAVGCGSSSRSGAADKAGGSTAPVVLRVAVAYTSDQPDAPLIKRFAAEVAKLSRGRLRVRLFFDVGGASEVNVEARIAASVRRGDYDMGWIGARAWDELGLKSFQALQAPFLITNYALLERVAKSPLAGEMLAGLRREHVVGVALIPGLLRHPVGLSRPLLSLSDYAGVRIRDIPSKATDATIAALGAVPRHVSNSAFPGAAANGLIDGVESSFAIAPLGGIVTGNVTLYAKALTLFANERAYSRLSEEQQRLLREAGAQTLHSVADFPIREELAFDGYLAQQFCRHPGRVVLASDAQLAVLERAVRPVYAELEHDPETKRMIAAIRKLGASLPQPPPIRVPAACARPAPAATVGKVSSLLNGTYRWRQTKAMALAFGAPASDPENDHYPSISTAVLRDGVVTMVSAHPPIRGTYTIVGRRLLFRVPGGGYVMTFRFTRDADGTLHLKGVPPIDRGDEWVWSGAPWHRIGPPIDTG